ncbi:hypothetical protein [Singulisphaera sp. PoT]|uniref:hypothetical protein n=1 Tax=Singulisphaera sp. PoT TaxID=3411797 RepID=UPI003BF58DCF
MPDPKYSFPGYPPFVTRAAADLGYEATADAVNRASRNPSLHSLASQVGQASNYGGEQRRDIFKAACVHRDALAIAFRAAELAIEAARQGLGIDEGGNDLVPVSEADGQPIKRRKGA